MSSTSLAVVVSGTSGSGKSTLVAGLRERLLAADVEVVVVHFDEFTSEADLPGGDVEAWLRRGASPDEWKSPTLDRHLEEVKKHRDPDGDVRRWVVLLEEPFGRARRTTRELTDYSIHLSLPLHIALARRLFRQFVPSHGGLSAPSTHELRAYLDRYLAEGADFYTAVDEAATRTADTVLDATLGPVELVEQALGVVLGQLGSGT